MNLPSSTTVDEQFQLIMQWLKCGDGWGPGVQLGKSKGIFSQLSAAGAIQLLRRMETSQHFSNLERVSSAETDYGVSKHHTRV